MKQKEIPKDRQTEGPETFGDKKASLFPWWKVGHTLSKGYIQFSSVAPSCPTLCDPMNCSTPGLPVHHQLLEFTPTRVHWVGDAIQPSHPLSSPSPLPPIPPSIRVFPNESLSKNYLYCLLSTYLCVCVYVRVCVCTCVCVHFYGLVDVCTCICNISNLSNY